MTDREEALLGIVSGEARGYKATLARGGLRALSWLYLGVITQYHRMYDCNLLKKVTLSPVVISVGNLTVGGSGKTTTVLHLARELQSAGHLPAILSYGYRAGKRTDCQVVSDRERVLMSAAEAGDEAVLLAESLPGVPVLIGRRRVVSGAEAVRRFSPDVLICDDAYQYWRLDRDIDLLLIDAVQPWGYGYVLPRGLLREPKSAARRATAVIITHADLVSTERLEKLKSEVQRYTAPVFTARHAPLNASELLGEVEGKTVLAPSSLGDPTGFESTLADIGAVLEPRRFPDHHRYTEEDVRNLEREAGKRRSLIITTAKDWVKIRQWADERLWRVMRISLAVDDEHTFRSWFLGVVSKSIQSKQSSGLGAPR